jgi:hypothetical protein
MGVVGVAQAIGRGAFRRGCVGVCGVKRVLRGGVLGPRIGRGPTGIDFRECTFLLRRKRQGFRGNLGLGGMRAVTGGVSAGLDTDELAGRDLEPGRGGRLDHVAGLPGLPRSTAGLGRGRRATLGVARGIVRARVVGRVGRADGSVIPRR